MRRGRRWQRLQGRRRRWSPLRQLELTQGAHLAEMMRSAPAALAAATMIPVGNVGRPGRLPCEGGGCRAS
eukprot:5442154-Pyramimonas_sp.AAC.1